MGVYKKDNRWYIDYYLPNSRRKREVVTIKGKDPSKITREDAKKALTIRKAAQAQGKFEIAETKTKPILFEKLASTFIEDYSKANKKSWARDIASCRALGAFFNGKRITQITPWQVDKYKSKRLKDISYRKSPVKQSTVNRELACLKKMLSYAVSENWLTSNPLAGYKLFKERPNKVRVVSREEFQRVYDCASELLKPILVMGIETGMRMGEILNLKRENVNLREGNIFVAETKTDEIRYVPISSRLRDTLQALRPGLPEEPVFQYKGKAIGTFRTAFNAAIRRSGVDKFTFHDLRHTFASILVMKGVDLATVQELLGHKSIVMTKRYSHPTPEHKRHAIELLDMGPIDTYLDTTVTSLEKKRR